MSVRQSKIDIFKKLTWGDLEAWAGSVIVSRGRNYQLSRHVSDLASTPDGALIAYVQGTQRYTTRVDIDDAMLDSTCTCPYDGLVCKHAVAIVLEFLDHLKRGDEVPPLPKGDPRPALLEEAMEEEEGITFEKIEPGEEGEVNRVDLHAFLEGKSKTELVAMMEKLTRENPEARRALEDRKDLASGSVKGLVQSIAVDIEELSSEPAWSHHWSGEGYIPDYSPVRERLEALLAGGYTDEVLELGEALLKAGTRQVEMSDDDGETGMEISSCLDVAFRALPRSSLSPTDQILWVVDIELRDQYDLCETEGHYAFWDRKFPPEEWDIAADRLLERLERLRKSPRKDEFSSEYRRDMLANNVIRALKESGREEEVIPLCEREAVDTGSYIRLVNQLIGAGCQGEAEQWIHKGIAATEKKWPGIARRAPQGHARDPGRGGGLDFGRRHAGRGLLRVSDGDHLRGVEESGKAGQGLAGGPGSRHALPGDR